MGQIEKHETHSVRPRGGNLPAVPHERKLWAMAQMQRGVRTMEIAQELGVTQNSLYNWRKFFTRFGTFSPTAEQIRSIRGERRQELEGVMLEKQDGAYSDEQRIQIVTAYEDGVYTAREIRDKFGIPHGELLSWRRETLEAVTTTTTTTTTTAHTRGEAVAVQEPKAEPADGSDVARLSEQNRVLAAEVESLKTKLSTARAQTAARGTELDSANYMLRQRAGEIDACMAQIKALEKQLVESRETAAELSRQLTAAKAEADELRARPIAAPADDALRVENEKLRARVRQLAAMVGDV